jgi:hypothetical protein
MDRMPSSIRAAVPDDASRMAELAEQKREDYKSHAPTFHRPKHGARAGHAQFLASLIEDEGKITLVHEAGDAHIDGFIVAMLIPAPPVYDPGGLTCLVDDFMVESPDLWASVGADLLSSAIEKARPRGAVQTVVVCGPQDAPKRAMLADSGHVVASEWHTKPFA